MLVMAIIASSSAKLPKVSWPIESEADRLILELYRDLFTNERDPSKLMLRKDLFELLEKAIDRCRDAGNVIYQIVLKNS